MSFEKTTTSSVVSHKLCNREISQLAQSLQVKRAHLEKAIEALESGLSVPFIARYRKPLTAGMDSYALRTIKERIRKNSDLYTRKETILKSIETLGKLTDQLKQQIADCKDSAELDDLFLQFKPKKQSFAEEARSKGLEAFAEAIWAADTVVGNVDEMLASMVNPEKGLDSSDKVLEGAIRILAEKISEIPSVRKVVRESIHKGKVSATKGPKVHDKQGMEFKEYFQFNESIQNLQSRKFLNIDRGVKQGFLSFFFHWDKDSAKKDAMNSLDGVLSLPSSIVPTPDTEKNDSQNISPVSNVHPHSQILEKAVGLSVDQLVGPSLEKEAWKDFSEKASEHASHILARFLNNRLSANPAGEIPVLAVIPGFRNGCILAALDSKGSLLEHDVVFPLQPQNKRELAFLKIEALLRKHQINKIAVANGNATKPFEQFLYEFFERLQSPLDPLTTKELEIPTQDTVPQELQKADAAKENVASEQHTEPPIPETTETVSVPLVENSATEKPVLKKAEEEAKRFAEKIKRIEEYRKQVADALEMNKALPEISKEVAFSLVLEAGVESYAASVLGKEEMPDLDANIRAAVSVGRRLQHPLKEMLKVDPVQLVTGILPVDVPHRFLRPALENVVESVVNLQGCDLNEADVATLKNISGLNQLLAVEIVQARGRLGKFASRQQLLEVPAMTAEKFLLSSGFLHVLGGDEPFDATNLNPENYQTAAKILEEYGVSKQDWSQPQGRDQLLEKARNRDMAEVAKKLELDSALTLRDYLDELIHPLETSRGRSFGPVYRSKILNNDELQPGMELIGVIQNIVDFGCFVDVGLKESGLVHISQISSRYVRSPFESVSVGDIVKTWVISVDKDKGRVSLTMIRPGSEQQHAQPRRERGAERPRRKPAELKQPQVENGPDSVNRQEKPSGQTPQTNRAPMRPNSGGFLRSRDAQQKPSRPPQRKPREADRPPQIRTFTSSKPIPKPNLSDSALAGKSSLGTFAELAVFWDKKKDNDTKEDSSSVEKPAE